MNDRPPRALVSPRPARPRGRTSRATRFVRCAARGVVAACGWDGTVGIWIDDRFVVSLPHPGGATNAAFSNDGSLLATTCSDQVARVWDTATWSCSIELVGHRHVATSAAWWSDGRRLATGSWDGTVRVWDVETGTCVARFEAADVAVAAVCVSSDGRNVAAGTSAGFVVAWNVETGERIAVGRAYRVPVESVAFSKRGDRLAVAAADGSFVAYAILADGAIVARFPPRPDRPDLKRSRSDRPTARKRGGGPQSIDRRKRLSSADWSGASAAQG